VRLRIHDLRIANTETHFSLKLRLYCALVMGHFITQLSINEGVRSIDCLNVIMDRQPY